MPSFGKPVATLGLAIGVTLVVGAVIPPLVVGCDNGHGGPVNPCGDGYCDTSIGEPSWCVADCGPMPPDGGADGDATAGPDGDAVDTDGSVSCHPNACPAGMVYVPCGPFVMGSDPGEGNAEEEPEHIVTLSAYCIDRTEVTVGQYDECVAAGGCDLPPCQDVPGGCTVASCPARPSDHPVWCVNWFDAVAYCAWAGKRLPTEAEWEKAARGGCEIVSAATCGPEDERTYPWGDVTPTCDHANCGCGVGGVLPVGSLPLGASPYGVQDMAGNVGEWVADWASSSYSWCAAGCTDPTGPTSGTYRGARGGEWTEGCGAYTIRVSGRYPSDVPEARTSFVGFRCVRTP